MSMALRKLGVQQFVVKRLACLAFPGHSLSPFELTSFVVPWNPWRRRHGNCFSLKKLASQMCSH